MTKAKIFQKKNKEGKFDDKYQIFSVRVKNKNNRWTSIDLHGYLVGLCLGFKQRANMKLASNVICVGSVGSGKSTLIKGMAGFEASMEEKKLDWQHICWTTVKFVEQYHNEEERGMPLIFDESIDGIGKMNTTTKGESLKKAVVTGRFMLRTGYYLTDELQEFSHKLVRMCNCLIRVRNFGFKRGYFEVYTNKNKIRFIYNGLKFYGKTWDSPEIKSVKPDCRGMFPDYSGVFYDEREYDKKKLEETKQEESNKISWTPQKALAFHFWSKGLKHKEIMDLTECSTGQIKGWSSIDFKKVVGT